MLLTQTVGWLPNMCGEESQNMYFTLEPKLRRFYKPIAVIVALPDDRLLLCGLSLGPLTRLSLGIPHCTEP